MTDIHQDTLHGGPSGMVYEYQQKYFTPAAKRIAKKLVSECSICTRYANNKNIPEIGVLPPLPVRPRGVFFLTDVDKAGPFEVREFRERFTRSRK
jgi:Integrase zinc binding domain